MSIYGSVAEADSYFTGRLQTDAWDIANDTDRFKALSMATRAIDRLNFIGSKTDPAQDLQFPRGDVTVPTDIKNACFECALAFLDGFDPNIEIENLAISSQGMAEVRNTYDRSFALEHIRMGIPSAVAWAYLKPYLRDPNYFTFSRVN